MDILRALTISKNKVFLILIISLISSILSVYLIPSAIKSSVTQEDINQQLREMSPIYGDVSVFNIDIQSIISSVQVLSISTILFILAYIIKYAIDKRLFSIKSFRDWKFFIYSSAFPIILIDIIQKIGFFTNFDWLNAFIPSFLMNVVFAFIVVFFSVLLLPEEPPLNYENKLQ